MFKMSNISANITIAVLRYKNCGETMADLMGLWISPFSARSQPSRKLFTLKMAVAVFAETLGAHSQSQIFSFIVVSYFFVHLVSPSFQCRDEDCAELYLHVPSVFMTRWLIKNRDNFIFIFFLCCFISFILSFFIYPLLWFQIKV
jgi:hypothetical protein